MYTFLNLWNSDEASMRLGMQNRYQKSTKDTTISSLGKKLALSERFGRFCQHLPFLRYRLRTIFGQGTDNFSLFFSTKPTLLTCVIGFFPKIMDVIVTTLLPFHWTTAKFWKTCILTVPRVFFFICFDPGRGHSSVRFSRMVPVHPWPISVDLSICGKEVKKLSQYTLYLLFSGSLSNSSRTTAASSPNSA